MDLSQDGWKLTPAQVGELEVVLDADPAACGYADQCWMLALVAEQVWRRFGVEYTLAGMDVLLHRLRWSVQIPARRAAEQGRGADCQVAEETWPVIKGRRTWAPGSASRTSPASAPAARWSRRPGLGLCGAEHNPSSVPGCVMWPAVAGGPCDR